ncbi:hypothetical protein M407DRAFT_33601 [Tulasnella calospora MUT 4182]|uniref:Uncharacterized protein n=1 Tax=Tulasnella calospora MUT 4182 TaxID=1051891 RepID=A0A0C3Q201_9AGAM|nr:hypothetical protein M407DRAFT_33601 [Tulasnella calospora MUT 4182]
MNEGPQLARLRHGQQRARTDAFEMIQTLDNGITGQQIDLKPSPTVSNSHKKEGIGGSINHSAHTFDKDHPGISEV